MKDLREEARSGAKEKLSRMTGPIKGKVDASGWKEPTDMHAEAPTGMRPVSRRAYKAGGSVAGDEAKKRADRTPRKSGGLATELMNRNQKDANEDRDGVKHVGGMKKGGRAERGLGGSLLSMLPVGGLLGLGLHELTKKKKGGDEAEPMKKGGKAFEGTKKDKEQDAHLAKKHGMSMKDWEKSSLDAKHDKQESEKGLKGRSARKDGGRAKGKTNINIIIAPQGGDQPQPAPMPAPPPRAIPMPMPPQGAAPSGGPPINISGLGGGMPQQMPPMGRKRGGPVHMTAGALSGEGRLQKIDLQRKAGK